MILKLFAKGWLWVVLSTTFFFLGSFLYVSLQDKSELSEVKYEVSKSPTPMGDDYLRFKNDILDFQDAIYNELSGAGNKVDVSDEVAKFIMAFKRLNSRDVNEIHNHCDIYNLFFSGKLIRQLSSSELDEIVKEGGLANLIDSKLTNNLSRICTLDKLINDKYYFEVFISEFNKKSTKSLFYNENSINIESDSEEFIDRLKAERVDKVNADKYYLKYTSKNKEKSLDLLNEYVLFVNERVSFELHNTLEKVKQSYIAQEEKNKNRISNFIKNEEYLSLRNEGNNNLKLVLIRLNYFKSLSFEQFSHVFYEIVRVDSSSRNKGEDKFYYGWLFIVVFTTFGALLGLSVALFKNR